MNTRRSFLNDILKAGVGAMILPSAVTYTRKKFKRTGLLYVPQINPAWINAPYEVAFYSLDPTKTTFDLAREQLKHIIHMYTETRFNKHGKLITKFV